MGSGRVSDRGEPARAEGERAAGLARLRRWLANQALLAAPVPAVASGFAEGLLTSGLPLWRAHVSVTTLDPQKEAVGLTWLRDGGRELEAFGHGAFQRVSVGSPIYDAVLEARRRAAEPGASGRESIVPMARYRLERGEGFERYPLLVEFRDEGATDYLVFVLPFSVDGSLHPIRTGAVATLAADRAGGFAEEDVADIAELMPAFGAALRAGVDLASIRTVLDTYLGGDVGRRVLRGEIRRGSAETISAAIMIGDLAGFTALADEAPRDQLVALLDDYLDCLVGPIESGGGQVLKFLGDGLLATFALGAGPPQLVCGRALEAALEALRRVEALNAARRAAGLPVLGMDVALHLGDVLYGNVGSDRRLDFTVVGPAVNEASRLEALCGTLGAPLLASRAFVDALGEPQRFRSLGHRALRGVRAPLEIFAPA